MNNTITMRHLGNMGRFGNALFEAAFLHVYARRYNLEVQTPPWVGCYLYGFNDPPITVDLPPKREEWLDPADAMSKKITPKGDEFCNHDFIGYAQFHTSYYRPDREFIQNLFTPLPVHVERLRPAVEWLRSISGTVIGVHIRRGDYGRKLYHCTPVEWYRDWLAARWHTLDNPIVFLATEDRTLKQEFADFRPLLIEDIGIELSTEPYPNYNYLPLDLERREPWQMDFFPEFHLLTQCDYMLAANSTYSFCAAMLNRNLREFWRSSLPARGFVQLDPWDTEPLALEQSEDYEKAIPGSRLVDNPYWK